MAYLYYARIVQRNPWLGRIGNLPDPELRGPEILEPGKMEPDWWYRGHPCETYLSKSESTLPECDGWEQFGGPCACCVAEAGAKGIFLLTEDPV